MDIGSRGSRGGQPGLGGSCRRTKMNPLQTALSNTTISGYVSASFNWAIAGGA